MAISIRNTSNVPMNVALHWGDQVKFLKNELKPEEPITFRPTISDGVWFDFTAVVDTGENRFLSGSNIDAEHIASYGFSLAGWVLMGAGVILAPPTSGISLVLTVAGAALAVGDAVVSGWLVPATLKGLYAPDGYEITIGVPAVIEESDADGRNTRLHGRPAIEALNLWTGNIVIESGWSGTEAVTALGNSVFAVQGGTLWEFGRRRWSKSHGDGWRGTEAMTSLNGKLYAVHRDRLWEKEPSKRPKDLGGDWTGTEAMTSLNGKLYAVQGDRLWEKEPPARSKDLGGGWSGTEAMTSANGKLYAVQGRKMWEKEPPRPSKNLGGEWHGTEAMTSFNGTCYAVHGSRLWQKQPTTGFSPIEKSVYHPVRGLAATDGYLAMIVGDQLWLKEI